MIDVRDLGPASLGAADDCRTLGSVRGEHADLLGRHEAASGDRTRAAPPLTRLLPPRADSRVLRPTRRHVGDYLPDLRARENRTIFLTTHYLDEADTCDRIAVIGRGRIVARHTGDPEAQGGGRLVTITTPNTHLVASELGARYGLTSLVVDGTVSFLMPRLSSSSSCGASGIRSTRSACAARPSTTCALAEMLGLDLGAAAVWVSGRQE